MWRSGFSPEFLPPLPKVMNQPRCLSYYRTNSCLWFSCHLLLQEIFLCFFSADSKHTFISRILSTSSTYPSSSSAPFALFILLTSFLLSSSSSHEDFSSNISSSSSSMSGVNWDPYRKEAVSYQLVFLCIYFAFFDHISLHLSISTAPPLSGW